MSEVRLEPVELLPGRWYFIAREIPSQRMWRVGYCAERVACPDCGGTGEEFGAACYRCLGQCSVELKKPCRGHDCAESALTHYLRWVTDQSDINCVGHDIRDCEVCGDRTAGFASYRDTETPLCAIHRNRHTLLGLLEREAGAVRA